MNDLQKLATAKSLVETAQAVLAEAGREIFDTCDLEDARAAIWSTHDSVKSLWHRLDSRAGELRTRAVPMTAAETATS